MTSWVSAGMTGVAVTVFVVLLLTYSYKWLVAKDQVMAELQHPVRINFLPTLSINLILLGMLLTQWFPQVGLDLWRVGAALQLILTVIIVNVWLNTERPVASINPAWFIPAVGNVLVPVAAAPAGYLTLSAFFLSLGLFFWAILVTVIFYRLITKAPLEPAMQPTLVIMVAPPAVSCLAAVAITQSFGPMAMALFSVAVFFVVLLLPQIPHFLRLSFYPSWWAYTFPLAAFTLACHKFSQFNGIISAAMLLAMTIFVTLVVLAVSARTLKALATGELAHH